MSKHLFATYVENYSDNYKNFEIKDPTLYHRIVRVLRLQEGEELIIFDKQHNSVAKIKSISKKSITFSASKLEKNKLIQPEVTLAIGMLKKDNFEQVIYNAVALGINTIQPLATTKSQNTKLTSKDRERLEKIMVAAAEQSKNFALTQILDPIDISQFLSTCSSKQKIFFDFGGKSLSSLKTNNQDNCTLLVGPEGDFSEEEKISITSAGFEAYKLTPTILKAVDAVTVGAGFIRSILN